MTNGEGTVPRAHEDTVYFLEAVAFTAAATGFSQRLIEKDYFCSVILAHLTKTTGPALVFKGGTCLAKVHTDFYRLSEDLDFAVPVEETFSRGQRSRRANALRAAFEDLVSSVDCLSTDEPLCGANQSTQYMGAVRYPSLVERRDNTIKIEVGLREPLALPVVMGVARTVLLDPVTGAALVPTFALPCLSQLEAFAEKFRAALTRRQVAIRDFFDIDYAVMNLGLQPLRPDMVSLVRDKITIQGNNPVDMSANRVANLQRQLTTHLRPVVRQQDFVGFELDRAVETVAQMARAISAA